MRSITQKPCPVNVSVPRNRLRTRTTDTNHGLRTRFTDSLERALLLFILLFFSFCLGLLLGGTVYKNKISPLLKDLDDTREMLQKHPSSVIVIKSDVADAMGFKLRNRYDLKIPSPLVAYGSPIGSESRLKEEPTAQRGEGKGEGAR